MKFAVLFFATTLFASLACANSFIEKNIIGKYVDKFNADDEELYSQFIPNSGAKEFLEKNIPLFECPDKEIEAVYYFRWWTFRKHIKKVEGQDYKYVITEFLPKVSWSGKHNAIACPAAFHFREGRWLRDKSFLESYARYWFDDGAQIRRYSFWPARAISDLCEVSGNFNLLKELYPKMKKNFAEWQKRNRASDNVLFWQIDNYDGMEMSISGKLGEPSDKSRMIRFKAWRPTINTYMYGESSALSKIAEMLGKKDESAKYASYAKVLKDMVNKKLWDNQARFYKPIPTNAKGDTAYLKNIFPDVRELHGYTPWFFNIPPANRSDAWAQISDAAGFKAPYGLTTAEQRHKDFAVSYKGHECLWDGPVWPFATSITLVSLANLLNDYPATDAVDKSVYFDALQTYAMAHHRTREDGKRVFWIDENINPYTGDWISRTRLKTWENGTWSARKGGRERGKDYNHSEFCDLIITGLVGFRHDGNQVVINPLAPSSWDYFCLENLSYRGRNISIVFDKYGKRYNRGAGLFVFVDDKVVAKSKNLEKIKISLK